MYRFLGVLRCSFRGGLIKYGKNDSIFSLNSAKIDSGRNEDEDSNALNIL